MQSMEGNYLKNRIMHYKLEIDRLSNIRDLCVIVSMFFSGESAYRIYKLLLSINSLDLWKNAVVVSVFTILYINRSIQYNDTIDYLKDLINNYETRLERIITK